MLILGDTHFLLDFLPNVIWWDHNTHNGADTEEPLMVTNNLSYFCIKAFQIEVKMGRGKQNFNFNLTLSLSFPLDLEPFHHQDAVALLIRGS